MKGLLAVAVFLLVAPSAPVAAQAQETARIEITAFQFLPPVAEVEPGQAVSWTNTEPVPISHNVFPIAYRSPSGEVDTTLQSICGLLQPGQTCLRNDAEDKNPLPAGTYLYTCTVDPLHAALMRGILVIE